MRILITGASGLVGSSLMSQLSHHELFNIHNFFLQNGKPTLDFSKSWEANFLPRNIDIIIHTAQSRYYKDFPNRALQIFDVNTSSTAKLLNYAHETGVKHFIYFSTGGVYNTSSQILKEDSHLLPLHELSHYFASKLSSEMFCNSYSNLLNVTILRPFFVFGRNQSTQMLIPRLTQSILSRTSISLAENRGIRINPIYVRDFARLILGIVEGRITGLYNVAGNEIVSVREISEILARYLGQEASYSSTEAAPDLVADNKNLLSFFPNFSWTPLEFAIQETLEGMK